VKSIFLLTTVLFGAAALASNYPADYCRQFVYSVTKGPLVASIVSGGCSEALVVGYKKSGNLAQGFPKSIQARVAVGCLRYNGNYEEGTVTIELGTEWNGTGYLSNGEHSISAISPLGCKSGQKISVLLHAESYTFLVDDIYRGETVRTGDIFPGIGLESWAAVVNEMKK
jgi:hypothetical protein